MKNNLPLINIVASEQKDVTEKHLETLFLFVTEFGWRIHNYHVAYKMKNKRKRNERNAGRKSCDPVLMFYLCTLKEYFDLSDAGVINMVHNNNRLKRFFPDKVPSSKTLWAYRKMFSEGPLFGEWFKDTRDACFSGCKNYLGEKHPEVIKDLCRFFGVDSTFLRSKVRRDSREINNKLRDGVDKKALYPSANVASHKDTDARFCKKNNKTVFGYKQHVAAELTLKLVWSVNTTPASMHDARQLLPLAETIPQTEGRPLLFADKGYAGRRREEALRAMGIDPWICKKASRNHKLTEEEKAWNKRISKVRARVEHVFSEGHNKKSFCAYSARYATVRSYIQYTIHNIKRTVSILSGKCRPPCLSDRLLA